MNPSFYGLVILFQRVVEPVHFEILVQRMVEPIHFMDFINFKSSFWMNLSSYGLMFLFQRVVEFVHFMDFMNFKSPSWMNLFVANLNVEM